MQRIFPRFDVVAARSAVTARDAGAFEHAMNQAGLAITLDALAGYVQRCVSPIYSELAIAETLARAYTARHARSGSSLGIFNKRTTAAVRTRDGVVFAFDATIAKGASPAAWAAEPARAVDALHYAVVELPSPSPDELARGARLLEEVLQDPDAEGPLSVYADWLEEHGDLRAGLFAAERGPSSAAALIYMRSIVVELVAPEVESGRLRGGVLTHAAIEAGALVREAQSLFAAHPLRSLSVWVRKASLARLANLDLPARLTSLAIGVASPRGAAIEPQRLARGAIVRGVCELRFLSCADTDDAWVQLFESLTTPKLRTLGLRRCGASPAALRAIAHLAGLETLELMVDEPWEAAASATGFAALAKHPTLRRIELEGKIGLAASSIERLLAGPIDELVLHRTDVDAAGLRTIATSRVRHLHLKHNDVAADEIAHLVSTSTSLEELVIHQSMRPTQRAALVKALIDAPGSLARVCWTGDISELQCEQIRATRQLVTNDG